MKKTVKVALSALKISSPVVVFLTATAENGWAEHTGFGLFGIAIAVSLLVSGVTAIDLLNDI
ncbi:MAG: hypothetical protein LBL08_00790 [Candidatus Nomurabacteria bacterium]|jgi:hypothetical protein|nr:hypothetical protein [Candidatus Nomurabacteria bacterium]